MHLWRASVFHLVERRIPAKTITADRLVLFALHVDSAVKSGVVAALALDTISPGTFPSLVIDLRSGVYGSTLGIGQGYLASSVGITTVSVVLVGLAWLLIPALASFFLARSGD